LRLRPGDWEAKFTLASVLGWGGKHGEAAALYRALGRERPADGRIPLRLAQMALWSGAHDDALAQFAKLLDDGVRSGEVLSGFIDSAAGASRLDAATMRRAALVVYDVYRADSTADPQVVGRLAWVLTRLKEHARAADLLARILAADPQSREVRRRLAEALTEAGEYKEAERHYRILLRSSPDRRP
jgi:tetratricopeptide (TPR) repeat protein